MKSHVKLLRVVLIDMGIRCCTSTTQDLKTILGRVENEGLSFLTITLPQFAKDLEKGLSQRKVDSTCFVGYAKHGCLPRFLGGFTSQVFDRCTGVLLEEPNVDAIYAIRQISLLFSKVELPCTDARKHAAMVKFIECEQSVRDSDRTLHPDDRQDFESMALRVFGGILAHLDRKVFDGEILPKHGPGSTADKLLGNAKFNNRIWTERLEELFPAGEFLFPSWSHYLDDSAVHWLDPGSEIPVRVITVPKTLKTPRIIAIEPTHMQYVQQGLMEVLVDSIQRDDILGKLVGFDDQEPNRQMAFMGSLNGELATLDLSEASDRVSNQLVRGMLKQFPYASKAIDATRSRKADVPGFGVKRLAKFASMGSALCFPIEAMVFLTIVLVGIERESSTRFTDKSLKKFIGKVRVYGDDIIVPEMYVHTVMRTLEAFGLKVNRDKSFWTGKFRESCGKEYYDGFDVSIVKVRRMLPPSRQHAPEVISTVSLRNQMYFAGNWRTAEFLDRLLEDVLGHFPMVLPESRALGRHSYLGYTSERECPNLQVPLVKAYVDSSSIPRDILDGPGALLKYFLKRSSEPSVDGKHLERAGRPKTVNIKLRWVSAI